MVPGRLLRCEPINEPDWTGGANERAGVPKSDLSVDIRRVKSSECAGKRFTDIGVRTSWISMRSLIAAIAFMFSSEATFGAELSPWERLHEGYVGVGHSDGKDTGTGFAFGLTASVVGAVLPNPGPRTWAVGDFVGLDFAVGDHSDGFATWGRLNFHVGGQLLLAPTPDRDVAFRVGHRWIGDNAIALERSAHWFGAVRVRVDELVLDAGGGLGLVSGGLGFRVSRLKYGLQVEHLFELGTSVTLGVWLAR